MVGRRRNGDTPAMALRNFLNAEMIALSAAWIDEKRHRPAFLAIPLLAGLLPEVEAAHRGLVSLSRAAGDGADAAGRELAEVQAASQAADRVHDRKGGGVLAVLEGAEQLADSDEAVARYAGVKRRLFPEGGAVFGQSYLAEAGNAERVEKELADPSVRAVLQGVTVRKGVTLLDEVRAFVAAGRELGVLESRKAALAATSEAPEEEASRRTDSVQARNAWSQTVGAVLAASKLLKGESAARFAPVWREFQAAQAKVDERAARRRNAAKTESDEGDEPFEAVG